MTQKSNTVPIRRVIKKVKKEKPNKDNLKKVAKEDPKLGRDGLPFIKDNTLYKAVWFVRVLINDEDDPLPIELAIYKSAKYYEISQHDLAKEMGRLGSFIREKKKKYKYW